MKKTLLLFGISILGFTTVMAQNVGINSDGSSPDASAGLDVKFTDKGLLIPRVALTATNAAGPISSPTTSLLVYNTATAGTAPNNVTPGYYYWNGSVWVRFAGNGGVNCNTTNYVIKSDGSNGTCSQIYDNGTNVGIGTTTPAYKLDVTSTIRAQDVFAAGGQNIIVGDDSYLSDVDVANTMGVYGIANTDRGGIKFGSGGATIFGYNNNIGVNTTTPAYTLDLNTGTFAFGNNNSRTQTRDDAGLQGNAGAQSGFFETSAPAPAADWPTGASNWWHLLDIRHSNNTNNYAMQFAGSFFDQKLYFRKTNNNATQAWSEILTSSSAGDYAWKTLGNSGTVAGTNFIGTTDAIDFVVKTNNTERMRILNTGNVGIGTTAPGYPLTVTSATAARTGSFTNTEASTDNYAVYGECATTDFYGYGGYFKGGYMGVRADVSPSGSNSYYGFYSSVSGGSGTNYGVLAYAYGSGHNNVGVRGQVNTTGSDGIIGFNSTTSTTQDYTTSAVYGQSTYDVNGMNGNTIYNAAVQGWDNPPNSHDGIGVFGHCWPADNWGYGGWFNAGYYGVRAEGNSGNYYKSGNSNDAYSGGLLAKGEIGINSIGSKIGMVTVSKELGLLSIGDINSNSPAAFFDGSVIRNGYEAMLINNGTDNVPAYTMVSNNVNIQSVGQALLNNGSANINFDYSFSSTVSNTQPIIVIITPTDQNTGTIVVTTTSANGFEVVSNNSNSNGSFNWIAIGRVKGYENTSVKQEYINPNFVNDKVDAIYPSSKDFPQFKSTEFFKTEKLKSTVKNIEAKDNKNSLNNNSIINSNSNIQN